MKEENITALSSLLLPIKNSDLFSKTVPLLEFISKARGKELKKVELVHVVGGSFLSTHLDNIDFRAGHVLTSDVMKRLRKQHYEEFVDPTMEKVQELLKESGAGLQANVRIETGDPVKKISSICEEDNYSTLIVARKEGDKDSFFGGTVLFGLLHRYLRASVYIVGEEGFPQGKCPASRVMIGIDGSEACLRAVREAAMLLARGGAEVEGVELVCVMDPACLLEERGIDCEEASGIGDRYNEEAGRVLVDMGVSESKINANVFFGRPGEMLTKYAESSGSTMCFIGRHDRSKIAEVILGSVCGDIIHRCRKTTVVLVS